MADLISREGNKVEFKVSVPEKDVQRAREQVWKGLAKELRIPGFRPGKAPRQVIEARVGKDYINAQVMDRLLQQHYPVAANELELDLIDANIEPGTLGKEFSFVVKGQTYPEVTLGDWKGLSLNASKPEITDESLERTLSDLQERNATFEVVERAIEENDQVLIQEEGQNSYPIHLDVAPEGIRNALIGKNKGDIVEIAPLGEDEKISVKILSVKTKKLQELDDDFAKALNFESMERLRTDLRAELERRADQEGVTARREELLKHLVDNMQVDIPEVLIDRKRDDMLNEVKEDLRRQGVQWREYENFMKDQDKLEEFMGTIRENAQIRVRRELAMGQLAKDLNPEVSELEFNQTLSSLAQINGIQPQQFVRQLGNQGLRAYYVSMRQEKAIQQALDLLSKDSKEEPQEATEEAKQEDSE